MTEIYVPDYLIVGHICKDNTPTGPILGGTCSYSALTAHRLGQKVGIVTSVGPDIPSLSILQGIQIQSLSHTHSTTFENIYKDGKRHQKWLNSSGNILYDDIPTPWHKASIVHLAPIGQEISPSIAAHFPNSLVGATMQGWLRGRDTNLNVIYQPHLELEKYLSKIDVLIISLSDLFGDKDTLTRLVTSVKVGVETLGPQGCRIYHNNQIIHVPVKPNQEVDPTGAGDIFAASFFIKYHQTNNCIQAAQFANACASLSVSGVGLAGVPMLSEVEMKLSQLYKP